MIKTQSQVKELFNYSSGNLIWKDRASQRVLAGDILGTPDANNYMTTRLKGKHYKLHRLIFLYHYGYLPKQIDHVDGDPANNNIENLRECTQSQNEYNKKITSRNSSGVKGVCWDGVNGKWRATIKVNGKQVSVGRYNDLSTAREKIKEAREHYLGEFANHG